MLDYATIFSKTGVILWSKAWAPVKPTASGEHPVAALVGQVLLEEKGGRTQSAEVENYALKWAFANEFDLVVVVVYQRLLQCLYADDLLTFMKAAISKHFGSVYKLGQPINPKQLPMAFDEHFEKCHRKAQQKLKDSKHAMGNGGRVAIRSSSNGNMARSLSSGNDDGANDDDAAGSKDGIGANGAKDLSDDYAVKGGDGDNGDGGMVTARALMKARAAAAANAPKGSHKGGGKSPKGQGSNNDSSNSGPPKKMAQVWRDDGGSGKLSKGAAASLDYSNKIKPTGGSSGSLNTLTEDELRVQEYQQKYLPDAGETAAWEDSDDGEGIGEDSDDDDDEEEEKVPEKTWFEQTAVGGFLSQITGNKVLSADEVQPILEDLMQRLVAKNVAPEIADDICGSVRHSLEGQRLGRFTRPKAAAVAALKDAVLRVLTPRKATDLLHEVRSHKGSKTPYVIAFVGINGVGKSTSLAKVCYYLKAHGVSCMMAACDTFRSGAVEQLRSHAACLDVPLFEKGYLKDPGEVAKLAIADGQQKNMDVVLIDTAGRMQNNDKLMRELAKLVQMNKPNKLLFVGEALVGNDGIDQLNMFNKALATYLPSGQKSGIDGIVLTKFDTIDDKVGATLSMSYKTGSPVVFVGTGQKYTHLKKLNVNSVVRALFS